MISLIAAMTRADHVIGYQGSMPWHLPADLAWFKQRTLGKPIIMGRKTWQSLGRALPNRRNIVVSNSYPDSMPNVDVVPTPEAAINLVANSPEIMIIGGAQLYAHFLPQAQRLYLTFIEAQLIGDTFFPNFNAHDWQLIEEKSYLADQQNPYNYSFTIYERL
ncbi:MAG: type 3 dihydrofolate reductase [Thiothrix sp.]|nr:MAG: type 3 dihydrofolate reductase [Thiothrix sp.]